MQYQSAAPDDISDHGSERSADGFFEQTPKAGYLPVLQQFSWMGWSAFGGPSAHIGLFQKVSADLSELCKQFETCISSDTACTVWLQHMCNLHSQIYVPHARVE